ncbi:MAG: radical SAM protein [bacterium]
MESIIFYDKSAYVLSLNGFCNNRCANCVCGNNRSKSARTRESIIREAESARELFDGFILSEGEPTMLNELAQIITDLKKLEPEILQIHTNGRMFAYKKYLQELLSVEGVDYLVKINGAIAATHDKITKAEGSWAQTIKGIAGLAQSDRKKIGLHVSISVTPDTINELDAAVKIISSMNPDSIIFTGGYPACGELEPSCNSSIDNCLLSITKERGADKIRSQFLYGEDIIPSYNHKIVDSPSGLFFVGADTNNPWVLRHAGESAKRSLIVYMPYNVEIDKFMVVAAPTSIGILKAFSESLGYPCNLIDLEARNQSSGVDIGRHYPKREFFEKGDFYALLSDDLKMKACLAEYEQLLPPEELQGYDVIALSMIDKISLSSGAAGVRYLRNQREDAVITAGVMQESDFPHFKDYADYCFEFMHFGGYSFCGLLNMLEFGDRSPAALRRKHGGVPGSNKINFSDIVPIDPKYDFSSCDTSLYFRNASAELLEFADSRKLSVETTPTGFASFYFSRGCKANCVMCSMDEFHSAKNPATSARRIIDISESSGLNSFYILDPAINNDEKGLLKFCETIIRSGKKIYWSSSARPSFKNPELLQVMRESGCVSLVFGIESGSQRIMSLLRKGFTVKMSSKALRAAAAAGIWTQINLISGFVTENESDVANTIKFLEDHTDCIDYVRNHSSFLWRDDVRMLPEEFGLRFVPGNINHICGISKLYEEMEGKSFQEILSDKLKAYTAIEAVRTKWHVLSALLTPYDVFHLYRSGYDRNAVHRFVEYLTDKYRDKLDVIVENAPTVLLRNEMLQALTMDFDATLPIIIPAGLKDGA